MVVIIGFNMKYIFQVFALVLVWGCANTHNAGSHPLTNKNLKIIDYPTGIWESGWLYHTEVMEYLFKSKQDRVLAEEVLLNAGYGAGKTDYIYVAGSHIAVNGKIFSDLNEAKEYIRRKKLKKVLYADASTFPKKIPDDVKMQGVGFWVLDWRK